MVFVDDAFVKTNLYILDGKIALISKAVLTSVLTINAINQYVIPGIIDPHVHFNLDLGKTHSKDDFYNGSICASFGGVTTFIDFLDPVDNPIDLEKAYLKRLEEAKLSVIDYKFHATIKNPTCDLEEFVQKMLSLGITSLKLFTTYSNSGRRTFDAQIIELIKLSEKYRFTLLAHIENDELIDLNSAFTFCDLSKSRPTISETKEALKLASFVRKYGGTLYMVHLSSGDTLERLTLDFPDILHQNFFVESCPHYFLFSDEVLQRKDGYLYTLAPPLRSFLEKEKLKSLYSHIDTIGTDHCSFFTSEKKQEFLNQLPLGIGGIEHSFEVMHSLFQTDSIIKLTKNVATIHNLKTKGTIEVGKDADLCIFEKMDGFIHEDHSTSDYCVYIGIKKDLNIVSTISRGKFIVKDKVFVGGFGTFLKGSDIS